MGLATSLTRRAMIKSGLSLACVGTFVRRDARRNCSPLAERPLPYMGVNVASAEFGKVPGQHGVDYRYPDAQDIDYVQGLGFNCVRIPFRWERLQPALGQDFDEHEWRRLRTLIQDVTDRGMFAIIDPHNFGKRRIQADNWTNEHVIGSDAVPVARFVEFWERLAAHFKDDPRAVFGLMNEPVGMAAQTWLEISNRALFGIRSAGAGNLVLIPGIAYSGAHSWLTSGNTVMAGLRDPGRNFAIEVHQYLDANSSGTSSAAVSGSCGSDRLRDFQAWARQHRIQAFLGEFAGGSDATSLNALADMCQEMSANPDVWCGWAVWSTGPFWSRDYIFNLNPSPSGQTPAQLELLSRYARPDDMDYWVRPNAAIDLDLERGRTSACLAPGELIETSPPGSAFRGGVSGLAFKGPLRELTTLPAFTILIETRDFHLPAADCEVLRLHDTLTLSRTAHGQLHLSGSVELITRPTMLSAWRAKQRMALSINLRKAHIAIAGTGCGTAFTQQRPALDADRTVTVSAGQDGGFIARVTAYDRFMSQQALADLVA